MKIHDLVNVKTLSEHSVFRRIIPILAFLSISTSLYCVFAVVPSEKVMGAVQRVFYFHVGTAMAAYAMIAVLFVSSVFYLHSKQKAWDKLGQAAASVAFMLCTAVLSSGMIWGHSAWNTWWRWEPRLVSFLVLWLILFSYSVLRGFTDGDARESTFSAVLGIIAAINVPIVIFSIKLLDHSQQLHPEVVAKQGLAATSYKYTLILSMVSVILFSVWLLFTKVLNLLLKDECAELSIDQSVLELG